MYVTHIFGYFPPTFLDVYLHTITLRNCLLCNPERKTANSFTMKLKASCFQFVHIKSEVGHTNLFPRFSFRGGTVILNSTFLLKDQMRDSIEQSGGIFQSDLFAAHVYTRTFNPNKANV